MSARRMARRGWTAVSGSSKASTTSRKTSAAATSVLTHASCCCCCCEYWCMMLLQCVVERTAHRKPRTASNRRLPVPCAVLSFAPSLAQLRGQLLVLGAWRAGRSRARTELCAAACSERRMPVAPQRRSRTRNCVLQDAADTMAWMHAQTWYPPFGLLASACPAALLSVSCGVPGAVSLVCVMLPRAVFACVSCSVWLQSVSVS